MASSVVKPGDKDILIAVDVQYDFMPGGALAVNEGDMVIPVINALAARFPHAILTQDWHPAGHSSFASSHPGAKPFETIKSRYGGQTLWPDHCVQGTRGAELSVELLPGKWELIVRKGHNMAIDSYSAFFENDRKTPTGLGGYLKERGFTRLFLAGLATDYCVMYSALDGRNSGFEVFVIEDACRGIDLGGSLAEAWKKMGAAGVGRIFSGQIA
ncbi:MAG: bifunctional nicotinamidase/pyrazinamidase [Nitrospinae bacterium]|nr:bifunctional nicotinamidase/pyrazinamidase [Nitrospinota bacterium]